MKKLMFAAIAALALAATGCKHIRVQTQDWSASYTTVFQSNDAQGLKVQAGENVHFELEKATSSIDPTAKEMLKTAADMMRKCADACETCAVGAAL